MSGSMSNQLNYGGSKAEEAKRVLREHFLPEVLKIGRAGILVFGGNCDDWRFTGNMETRESALLSDLARIGSPNGSTPLAWSIQQALQRLQQVSKPRSLLVITDGAESCGGDPCAVVRQARAKQEKIAVHTIGLGMSKSSSDFDVLNCMASESYHGTAQVVEPNTSPRSIAAQFENVAERVTQGVPNGQLFVEVKNSRGESVPVDFTVTSLEPSQNGLEQAGTGGVMLELPEGDYALSGNLPSNAPQRITIRAGKPTHISVNMDLGHLMALATCAVPDLSYVVKDSQGKRVATSNLADGNGLDLKPGAYRVVLPKYPNLPPRVIQVRANRRNFVNLGNYGEIRVVARGLGRGDDLKLPFEVFSNSSRGYHKPLATGATGELVTVPVGVYNVAIARSHSMAKMVISKANLVVKSCQSGVEVLLEQMAYLEVCGPSGQVRLFNNRTGELVTGLTNEKIPVVPGVYNVMLPNGKRRANFRVRDGGNVFNCR
jgi:hypothetical protein